MHREAVGWAYLGLLGWTLVVSTLALPHPHQLTPQSGGFVPARTPPQAPSRTAQLPVVRIERKFAEKPNNIKKVALDDFDDLQTNQISEGGGQGGGFSWSNLLSMLMQMIFPVGGGVQGPNKSEGLDETGVAPSPWANLISVGLKILTAILGGGITGGGDGIDKVDNGNSPMQGILAAIISSFVGTGDPGQVNMLARQATEFIQIVVNLLDALKTSFSHRSMAARHLGKKDTMSDAAVASIAMMKGYVRSLSSVSSRCMERFMCDANRECVSDVGQSSLLCHLGSYATTMMLERSVDGMSYTLINEAAKRGRSGDNCHQAYLECNEV